jgi:hypothetical protein
MRIFKTMTVGWRLVAIAGTAVIAGGSLAGCGSSSPTVTVTAAPGASSASAADTASAASSAPAGGQPGAAGLPPGQGTFQISRTVTQFDPTTQSASIQGTVDGLSLTATGAGSGVLAGGESGQGNDCWPMGVVGSSATGTLGGVPFTVKLTGCTADSNNALTVTYTGNWGSRAVNVTLTDNLKSDENGGSNTTIGGTIGTQNVGGTVNASLTQGFATDSPAQFTGTITVS